jgi:hypothetical protein
MISMAPPFVLRLSKDERRVFQQNQLLTYSIAAGEHLIIQLSGIETGIGL